jgi:hypothetical protein
MDLTRHICSKINLTPTTSSDKPVIAAGCDPVPFRTRKSNLSSLLCYLPA